jgi:hypothetical protein
MAVDLGDLTDNLIAEVNAPGEDVFASAVEDDYLLRLQNAFWEATLDGIISGYTETDGVITPDSGTTDISRELQQLVIFYAGISIVRNHLRNLNTVFRAKAGPVEFETQNAATVLRDLLAELQKKRAIVLDRLSETYSTDTYYIDAVAARDESFRYGDTSFVSSHEGIA